MPERDLGAALTAEYPVGAGVAQLHEGGLTLTAPGVALTGFFTLPPVGRPSILFGDPASRPAFSLDVVAQGDGWTVASLPGLVGPALAGRLVLSPLDARAPAGEVTVGDALASADSPGSIRLPVFAEGLVERVLYDVAVRGGDGALATIAPHAAYYRQTWTDFGLAHITDMHVARRIDRFRGLLREARRPAAAEALVNWNDRFRGFVRYANHLHRIGVLDVVVATGDLFDYMFEDDDDRAGGGNALFLRQLILGQAPGPEFPDVEPLLVPVFMVPGNHDYRRHPYRLIFDLHVGGALGVDLDRVKNFSGLGLRQVDATALANRMDPSWLSEFTGNPALGDDTVPNLSADAAARMVAIDPDATPYRRFLNDSGTYVVELGEHRILMVDSGPDVGIVDSILEAAAEYVGLAGEDEATFLGGSPNCKGPSAADVDTLAALLSNAADNALVMVATHAPYVNLWHTEYPYFLRETQRRHHPDLVTGHLIAMGPLLPGNEELVPSAHSSWFGPAGQTDVDFVKRGDNEDLLDFGVSRGETGRLLRVITGMEARRPADLVLAGHTHRDDELVIRRTADGGSAFFFDFYTGNPGIYYPSLFQAGSSRSAAWVTVVPGAAAEGRPTGVWDGDYEFEVAVPPRVDTLADSSDPAGWWAANRPLMLQTAALGPLSGLRDFAGFRVVEVAGNVVRQVYRVPIDRLADHGYVLDWEAARAPLATRRVPAPPWLRVSEGSTAPGGWITQISVGISEVMLFLADPGGGVYTCRGDSPAWGPWRSISEGASTPGGVVTALVRGGRIHVFLADPGGGVYTANGDGTTWGPWRSVSEGATTPGAPVTAVVHKNRIHLFLADPGGGVYTVDGDGTTWGLWRSVSEGATIPGGTVTATEHEGKIAVFLADTAGGIYGTRGARDSWAPWSTIAEGVSLPGRHVAALSRFSLARSTYLSLALAGPAGGVYAKIIDT